MAKKKTEQSSGKDVAQQKYPGSAYPPGLISFHSIEQMFDDYLNRNWLRGLPPLFDRSEDLWGTYEMRQPRMDIIDHDQEILVRAELPGVDKKDLDISISGNNLTIKGSSRQERKDESEDYQRREIRSGSFCRSMTLPNDVDSENISADFKNGLLELKIPKTISSERKTIKVS